MYIRNYTKGDVYRRIALDYFPVSLALSESESYIAVGTKDGSILFITRIGDHNSSGVQTAFNLDIFGGHYDITKCLSFSNDERRLYSASYNEIFVWNVKQD